MSSRKLLATITLVVGYWAAEPSAALPVISTGTFTPTSPTFVVPIEITGASDLVTWQFDLSFNPTDFQINLSCDPNTDSFCDPINGPVTEGPFTSKNGTALSLFVPGVADNTAGLLSIVSGAYLDLPPGPSGSGVLAFVEFAVQPNANLDSPITVQNPLVTQGSSSVVDEPPMVLLVFAALILTLISESEHWLRNRRKERGSVLKLRGERNMKQNVHCTLGLLLLAMVGFATSPAGAATTATGPYYADPSWDQQLPASTRFVVLSNWIDAAHPSGGAAVLDRETGLVWESTPSGSSLTHWNFTLTLCAEAGTGNRRGWRTPSIQELASLIDPANGNMLPAGNPFQGVAASPTFYWSATSSPDIFAWVVAFGAAGPHSVATADKSDAGLTWCVRGGSGPDSQ